MKYFFLISLFFIFDIVSFSQNPPKIGLNNNLEIGNWNLEWFGKTSAGFGPSDDALQQANVLKVIQNADVDLWGFCEVCKLTVFDSMMLKLPNYGYKICNYAQEQKTAFIYKKSLFTFIDAQLLGTQNPDSFSTRRFPFSIRLKVKDSFNFTIDTLQAIVMHLKANVGNDAEKLTAYNSRILSSNWLKMYLGNNAQKNIIVLGDWNDDLDESIYNGLPTPFAGLLNNTFNFKFVTKALTDINQGTTTSYPNAIDHQFISGSLKSKWVNNSTKVLKLEPFITNYSSTTSDHYPVYSFFNANTSRISTVSNFLFEIYPNPTHNFINIKSSNGIFNYKITNSIGQVCLQSVCQNQLIDVSTLTSGVYLLAAEINGVEIHTKFFVTH
ncbi:MAG: T9SS type A sorting domain-containing protein [Bacteroidetes bacterium]|nr:T9SS type A sorting domain-containing protein [Bacteroidota bacterium]